MPAAPTLLQLVAIFLCFSCSSYPRNPASLSKPPPKPAFFPNRVGRVFWTFYPYLAISVIQEGAGTIVSFYHPMQYHADVVWGYWGRKCFLVMFFLLCFRFFGIRGRRRRACRSRVGKGGVLERRRSDRR